MTALGRTGENKPTDRSRIGAILEGSTPIPSDATVAVAEAPGRQQTSKTNRSSSRMARYNPFTGCNFPVEPNDGTGKWADFWFAPKETFDPKHKIDLVLIPAADLSLYVKGAADSLRLKAHAEHRFEISHYDKHTGPRTMRIQDHSYDLFIEQEGNSNPEILSLDAKFKPTTGNGQKKYRARIIVWHGKFADYFELERAPR